MNIKENAVIIFCRYPAEGKVKNRLAEITGKSFATEFYRLCTEHVITECKKNISSNLQYYIFFSDEDEEKQVRDWIGTGFEFFPQCGGDLGERMSNSFEKFFNVGFKKIMVIGTDIPDLSADIINHSLIDLDNADYVIGPALDGGFYLLGMKKHNAHIFENIKWSRENVLNSLVKNITGENKTIKFAEKLSDIDTIDDLKNWLNSNKNNYTRDLKNIIMNNLLKD